MARELGISSTNSTQVLQQAMITSTCMTAMTACTGENAVYQSFQDCASQLRLKELGEWGRLAGKYNYDNHSFG
jgi:hypothetical protein